MCFKAKQNSPDLMNKAQLNRQNRNHSRVECKNMVRVDEFWLDWCRSWSIWTWVVCTVSRRCYLVGKQKFCRCLLMIFCCRRFEKSYYHSWRTRNNDHNCRHLSGITALLKSGFVRSIWLFLNALLQGMLYLHALSVPVIHGGQSFQSDSHSKALYFCARSQLLKSVRSDLKSSNVLIGNNCPF